MRSTCPWWFRWSHRSKRKIDRNIMVDTIIRTLQARGKDTPENRTQAVQIFLKDRGQEHWWCPCAHYDRRHLMRHLHAIDPRPL